MLKLAKSIGNVSRVLGKMIKWTASKDTLYTQEENTTVKIEIKREKYTEGKKREGGKGSSKR